MTRTRTPRTAGDLRRKENMNYLRFMVELAMPDGVTREELLRKYAYETGLTVKKATEHLDLLLELNLVSENDLRIYYVVTQAEKNIQLEARILAKAAPRTRTRV